MRCLGEGLINGRVAATAVGSLNCLVRSRRSNSNPVSWQTLFRSSTMSSDTAIVFATWQNSIPKPSTFLVKQGGNPCVNGNFLKMIIVVVRRLSRSQLGNRRSSKRLVADAERLCYPSRCGGVSALGLAFDLWTS